MEIYAVEGISDKSATHPTTYTACTSPRRAPTRPPRPLR